MTPTDSKAPTDVAAVAAEALAALDAGRQIAPFSTRLAAFDFDDAYRVTAAVRRMREARGERRETSPCGNGLLFTRLDERSNASQAAGRESHRGDAACAPRSDRPRRTDNGRSS